MKIDYKKTIDGLKENGLILQEDKYAVCLFRTESDATTMTTSSVDYVMTANNDEIKLFSVHKKTGEYLGDYLVFKKEDIAYSKKLRERNFVWASKGLFGGINIAIRFIALNFSHDYLIPKKLCGYEQIEDRLNLFAFVNDVYNTHYKKLENEFKGKN